MRYRRQVTMFTMMFLLLPGCVTPRRNGVPEAINITRSHRAPDENAVVEVVKAVVEPAGRVAEALADVTSPLANGIGDAFRALGRWDRRRFSCFRAWGRWNFPGSWGRRFGCVVHSLVRVQNHQPRRSRDGGWGIESKTPKTAENAATE